VPLLLAVAAWTLYTGLRDKRDASPFLASLAIFILSFAGIGISFYPHIVPPSLTIWEAAAPASSLAFTLAGAAILLPVILGYTAYAYWVFKGKVKAGEGYH
jgi:cytochrome d ubiquinol oxidase subunit II